MRSTMMEFALTVRHIFEHGRALYGDSEVVTSQADGARRIEFMALADRAGQLAAALRRLGVEPGDRVATFGWNNQEHQEAYFAVPCMGAVMHTLNIRLSAEQLRFIIGIPEEVDAEGGLETPVEGPPGYDETLGVAYKRRPELADLKNRLGTATELVKVCKAGNKPRLDFQAAGGYKELTLGHTEFDGKTWSVGVAVTFPFFDGLRTEGKVAQAKSDVSTLKIEEAKTLDAIALQVRDSLNKVRESVGIVEGLSGTVAQAERLLQMAGKGYEYGVKTHLDVEDAELNLTQAKGSLAQAWRDYLVARVTLTWAMGILGEDQPFRP